jgi:hypothetical protein
VAAERQTRWEDRVKNLFLWNESQSILYAPEKTKLHSIMKLLFLLFTFSAFSFSCSDSHVAPLEGRVLSEEEVGFLEYRAEELKFNVERAGFHEGKGTQEHFLGSKGNMQWGYSIWFDSTPEEGSALLADYESHLVERLKGAGAKILKQEEIDVVDSHTGFTIEYSKSKVSGGISVTYNVGGSGRNLYEVSQFENQ